MQPNDLVLDIGTGTGLLAMMAARRMRQANGTGSVVGCEVHPATAMLARRIVAANGLEDTVDVVGVRSNDLVVGDPGACGQFRGGIKKYIKIECEKYLN